MYPDRKQKKCNKEKMKILKFGINSLRYPLKKDQTFHQKTFKRSLPQNDQTHSNNSSSICRGIV